MKKIWFSFLILILGLSVLNPLNISYENAATILVLLHSIIIILILTTYEDYKLKPVLILAFLLRLFLAFWDIYARSIFILPNAATDDVGFYRSASQISKNLLLLSNDLYGGLYAKITGFVFYLTGPSRILGNYINVILGISVVIIILKILKLLNINKKNEYWTVWIASFFPSSLFMSAMFRREMIITFLVILSLFYFVNWFIVDKISHLYLAILLILFASMFHSGVIGIIGGYIVAYIFYGNKTREFKLTVNSIFSTIIIGIFLFIIYVLLGEQILTKFGNLNEINTLVKSFNHGGGGARYLANLQINNILELIVYSPIKFFYFISSPVPWEWRGLNDILTFLFDSSIYLIILVYYLINKKNFNKRNNIIKIFFISILVTSFIFGIGTGNAGTALRHRQKLLPIFTIFLAIMLDNRKLQTN